MDSVLLAVGTSGVRITIPSGVKLLPVCDPLDLSAPLDAAGQRARVEAALAAPQGMRALKEYARERRRAAVVVGDLALPAPYEIALPALVAVLVDAGIRPTRVGFLAFPGRSGPVLGRAAIKRYGEEIVGDHELRAWQSLAPGEPDPFYAAADLRIVVTPATPSLDIAQWLPATPRPDCVLELSLGRRATIGIDAARCVNWNDAAGAQRRAGSERGAVDADVLLIGGGGSPWETTLEEALLSLYDILAAPQRPAEVVLIFSGNDGMGSARFTGDVWNLLRQAEELLAAGGSLSGAEVPEVFDPAETLAAALSGLRRLVLFSPGFSEHADGDDWREYLPQWPRIAERVQLCASEPELWQLLSKSQREEYRLAVTPLGWRAWT